MLINSTPRGLLPRSNPHLSPQNHMLLVCTCPNLLTGNVYKGSGEVSIDYVYCAACLILSFIGLSLGATILAYITIGTFGFLKTVMNQSYISMLAHSYDVVVSPHPFRSQSNVYPQTRLSMSQKHLGGSSLRYRRTLTTSNFLLLWTNLMYII